MSHEASISFFPHPFTNAIPSFMDESRALSIASLLIDALDELDQDPDFARVRIKQAMKLASGDSGQRRQSGSLAPWQETKAKEFIDEHLGHSMRIDQAAAAVRLSPNYFSRAFKASFGQPFSQYVITQRIALAKYYLRHTNEPLGQIAVACGLSDQAHLSRLFRTMVGARPSVWRRSFNRS